MEEQISVSIELPDLIPARIINEYKYCPRLAYMEWTQGEFVDSVDTIEGRFDHKRVDKEGGDLPGGEELKEADEEKLHARSVMLSAQEAGLIARIDLIEAVDGKLIPIDYKHGAPPDGDGVWDTDRVQLVAQCIILRENGYRCDGGVIYYVSTKKRVNVEVDDALVNEVTRLVSELRNSFAMGGIPPPLVDSPKCPRCSLVGICLPDETNFFSGSIKKGEIRRLAPARDDALPVYVQEQGAYVSKSGERMVFKKKGKVIKDTKLIDCSQLVIMGNVQVSTQALRELCVRGIPICYFSYGGWFYGMTMGLANKNVDLRVIQYRYAEDVEKCLKLARYFVSGKIRNSRTIIRQNHPEKPIPALAELSRLARRALSAKEINELLGIEGAAARVYFSHFGDLIKGETKFDFRTRNRRPPRDPANALLSFMYALLTKEITITSAASGFDPYLGFFHRPRYGRPSLALDLMEEFRPIIADSVVLSIINGGEVKEKDFIRRGGAVALTRDGRKKVLSAYERRMDSLVKHPFFGYSISYRRVLSVQVRLLARYLVGEIDSYPPFLTR